MNVTTGEGTVEKGQIKVPPNVHLPDNTSASARAGIHPARTKPR
jgi:hypothetical protein